MTDFKIPTIFEQKAEAALKKLNVEQKSQTSFKSKEFVPIQDSYVPPSDH